MEGDPKPWIYLGLTSNPIKHRIGAHYSDFKVVKLDKPNPTTICKKVWNTKLEGKKYTVRWSVVGNAKSRTLSPKTCNLCTKEALFILKEGANKQLLNSRDEVAGNCPHRRRHILKHQ